MNTRIASKTLHRPYPADLVPIERSQRASRRYRKALRRWKRACPSMQGRPKWGGKRQGRPLVSPR